MHSPSTLPYELVGEILRHVTSERDLFSVRQASKAFRANADPIVFRAAWISQHRDASVVRLARYFDWPWVRSHVTVIYYEALFVAQDLSESSGQILREFFSRTCEFQNLSELRFVFIDVAHIMLNDSESVESAIFSSLAIAPPLNIRSFSCVGWPSLHTHISVLPSSLFTALEDFYYSVEPIPWTGEDVVDPEEPYDPHLYCSVLPDLVLRPSCENLVSLHLKCKYNGPVPVFPDLLAIRFARLRELAISYLVFPGVSSSFQDFIIAHRNTLRSLSIFCCALVLDWPLRLSTGHPWVKFYDALYAAQLHLTTLRIDWHERHYRWALQFVVYAMASDDGHYVMTDVKDEIFDDLAEKGELVRLETSALRRLLGSFGVGLIGE